VELTLSQAIQTALANNLGIQLSREELEIVRGGSEAEQGIFDSYFERGSIGEHAAPTCSRVVP